MKKKKKIFCEMMRGKREKMVRILNTTALRSLCICPRFIFSFFHILHNVLYLLNSLVYYTVDVCKHTENCRPKRRVSLPFSDVKIVVQIQDAVHRPTEMRT